MAAKARRFAVQRKVGDYPLKTVVLIRDLLQPFHLGWRRTGMRFLLAEVGGLTLACLAADLCDRRPFLARLQDEHGLRVRKLRCLHTTPLLFQPGKRNEKLQLQTLQSLGIGSIVIKLAPRSTHGT